MRASLEEALLAGAMSVVGLARHELAPAVLGDAVFLDRLPTSVEVVYGAVGVASGSQVRVTTSWRLPGARVRRSPVDLAEVLARQLPPARGGSAPIRIDDRPVFLDDRPCRVHCQLGAGDARWAVRLSASSPEAPRRGAARSSIEERAVEVTVVARDWSPAEVCLDWIGDLTPFLAPVV
ncbi:MAG: hypothetical protein JWO62_2507 [Acidimicrobiaceae bacterium]|nr:hypothetical protein [Acidimicrobiaceae bacterium]